MLYWCVLLLVWIPGEDWSQWRGPARDGHSKPVSPPETETLIKVWSVEVGAGLASPIRDGDIVYVLTREQDQEIVTALSWQNGRVVWKQIYDADFFANAQAASPRNFPVSKGKGPFATPAVEGQRLITLGVNRTLSCFDKITGALLWRHTFFKKEQAAEGAYVCPPCRNDCDQLTFEEAGTCPTCRMILTKKGLETTATFEGPNYYGAAASPLLHDDLVLVYAGHVSRGDLIAVQLADGEERWRWQGPGVSSSSPVTATIGGVDQVVVVSREGVTGIDLKDGQPLWNHVIPSNAQIVTPVVTGDLVIYAGYRGPVTALKVRRDKKSWHVKSAWTSDKLRLEMSSPILKDQVLFGFFASDRGQFGAIDLSNGETLWTSPGRQSRNAHMVLCGDVVWSTTAEGDLILIDTDRGGYKEHARFTVADSPVWTHALIDEGRVLIKDAEHLTMWSW